MDWLFIGGILLFVAILMVTIAVHEAGHMTAAKILKLDVPEYSIGFGPKLFTKIVKGTAYSIRAIPLGGFVLIQDRRFPEKSYERDALARVSPWKRQIVFMAGPAVNIIIGISLLLGTLMVTPYHETSNHVGKLYTCSADAGCAAATAGLQEGDEIVNIDGTAINSYEDIAPAKEGKTVLETITVNRGGEEIIFKNMELKVDQATGVGFIGIQAHKDVYRSLGDAWTFVTSSLEQNIKALVHLPEKAPKVVENIVTGDKGAEDPASVVAAGKSYGDLSSNTEMATEDKVFTYFYWSALFNLGIGLLNLLPLLPLDGGRMMIAFFDSIRNGWSKIRKSEYNPIGKRFFVTASAVSALMVFGFMGLIIASDFSAIFAGNL